MRIAPGSRKGKPMGSDPTVFVVDDSPEVRDSLSCLLESAGLRVRTFPSAQDFLDTHDRASSGCLVLDVRLPGMSGLELQEHLGAEGVTMPVIMITAYSDVPTAVRSFKAGAFEFIQKPFSPEILLERCRRALEVDRQMRTHDQLGILSPKARIVLGCLQLLDEPHLERIAEAAGVSSIEVGHCIAELYAVYCREDRRSL
jgi:FixJ family two-component response regulator